MQINDILRKRSIILSFFLATLGCKTPEVSSEEFGAPSYGVFSDEVIQSLITQSVECGEMVDFLTTGITSGKIDESRASAMAEDLLLNKTSALISRAGDAFNGFLGIEDVEERARLEKLASVQLRRVNLVAASLKKIVKSENAPSCAKGAAQCEPGVQSVMLSPDQQPLLVSLAQEIGSLTDALIKWRDDVVGAPAVAPAQRITQGVYLSLDGQGPCVVEVYPEVQESDEGEQLLNGIDIVAIDSQWLGLDCRSYAFQCAKGACKSQDLKLEFGPNRDGFFMNGSKNKLTFARMDVSRGDPMRAPVKKGIYSTEKSKSILTPMFGADRALAHIRIDKLSGDKVESSKLFLCGSDNCERRCQESSCPEIVSLTPEDKFALQNAVGEQWNYSFTTEKVP